MDKYEKLLIEINDRLKRIETEQLAEKRKRLIILIIVLAIIIILAIIITPKVIKLIESYNQLMADFNQIKSEFDQMKSEIDSAISVLESFKNVNVSKVKDTFNKIENIDFQSLTEMIENLKTFTNSLSKSFLR